MYYETFLDAFFVYILEVTGHLVSDINMWMFYGCFCMKHLSNVW